MVAARGRGGARRPRCAGLVLVDGGLRATSRRRPDVDVDEFLRGLDEPPEVMRSMDAYLADRRGLRSRRRWDADQERAARAAVVETPAGHGSFRPIRPHALEASVRSMFAYRPAAVLPRSTRP